MSKITSFWQDMSIYLYFFRPNAKSSRLSPCHEYIPYCWSWAPCLPKLFLKARNRPSIRCCIAAIWSDDDSRPPSCRKTAHRNIIVFARIVESPRRSFLAVLEHEWTSARSFLYDWVYAHKPGQVMGAEIGSGSSVFLLQKNDYGLSNWYSVYNWRRVKCTHWISNVT